jgi:hypothetical protein
LRVEQNREVRSAVGEADGAQGLAAELLVASCPQSALGVQRL